MNEKEIVVKILMEIERKRDRLWQRRYDQDTAITVIFSEEIKKENELREIELLWVRNLILSYYLEVKLGTVYNFYKDEDNVIDTIGYNEH